jgi:MipA family protein
VADISLAQESVVTYEQVTPTDVVMPAVATRLPLWEAGVFGFAASQAAYPGSDERVNLIYGLPYVIYRGEYLRVDRGTVGVRAIKTERTELDVGFDASLGSRAEEVEARRGMDDLGILLEFGPRLKITLGDVSKGRTDSRIQLPLRGVFDASDHFGFRGIAFEPQWVFDKRLAHGWQTSLNLGAVFGDQKLVDTFYRVLPAEATALRPSYDAKPGLIALRAGMFVSHAVSHDVRFFGVIRLDSVNGSANYNSPLIRRDHGWFVGIGLAWALARSEARASD